MTDDIVELLRTTAGQTEVDKIWIRRRAADEIERRRGVELRYLGIVAKKESHIISLEDRIEKLEAALRFAYEPGCDCEACYEIQRALDADKLEVQWRKND